ncbi:MAG TPA: HAD family hydrolase [Acidimicrobiales bacterium]|jgi:putative hydrolase of the HAD superfamily|nr:HAD family hydrolase [Acidimicrobiales bacterium]
MAWRPDLIGLDADDTLWHSEDGFKAVEARFAELVEPWATVRGVDAKDALAEREREDMILFGYGVKAFTISMVECAIELSGGTIPAHVLHELVDEGRRLLARPPELFDGVVDAVLDLAQDHRIVVITKGDLLHQERKLAQSGLADHVHGIEVVSEKDADTYRRVLDRLEVRPEGFLMVGNSVRSDVLPVLAIGGRAVHIPYEHLWWHEHVDGYDGTFPALRSLGEVRSWLQRA